MASSDNVLRAGLTSKHIDIPDLIDNVDFVSKPESSLLISPSSKGESLFFSVPVDDFSFSLHRITLLPIRLFQNSAAILFCINGYAIINSNHQKFFLKLGESIFISALDSPIIVSGNGFLARVYNKI